MDDPDLAEPPAEGQPEVVRVRRRSRSGAPRSGRSRSVGALGAGARRQWRRFRRQDGRRIAGEVVAVLALLGLAWSVWVFASAMGALSDVRDEAVVMKASLLRGDTAGTRQAMADYRAAAERARSRTDGLTWAVFEKVPFLGDDAEGVATAAQVLADLGQDGIPQVTDAADLVTADTFQPRNGAFPIAKITAMQEPARTSEQAFDRADSALEQVDAGGFLPPVARRFDQLRTIVQEARASLGTAYRASRLIPKMLGPREPRYYLLVLQNNAELRSGGGLPGSLSLVKAHDGRIDIVEQTDMSDLAKAAGTDPVVRLTPEENRVFGRILGLAAVDATLTPDFPRSADIIRARWERGMGSRLDGMIFVDPVAVSYLMRGTGQIPLPGYPAINSANVVPAVENAIYLASNDRQVHSAYQQLVAKAVFNAFAAGAGDTTQSIAGLAAAVGEGRVRMHYFTKADQDEIAGTAIAGEFPRQASDRPEVGLYLNDGGPTKMQYYLRYDASVISRSCVDGRQVVNGKLDLLNDTPDRPHTLPSSITGEGYPGLRVQPGEQLIILYLTSPIGGTIEELSIDGQRQADPVLEPFAGRQLARIGIHLDPRERHRLEFVASSGPGQTGPVHLTVTPGAHPGNPSGLFSDSCEVH